MWIKRIGLGILIGVILCSVVVNAGEKEDRRMEPPSTIMERICDIPRKIYGKKRYSNKVRRAPGKFKLPPDARIGDIIKTKKGYKQIVDIRENGQFRLKSLKRKYNRKEKRRAKKRYNQKTRKNRR